MKNIDQCLQRQNFTQDKFQTYICWMLLAGALFAMIPPIAVVVTEQRASGTCAGTEFIVYAHYSTHDWLIEQFEKFKSGTKTAFSDVCYELKIEDSALSVNSKPSIWIPETSLWLDIVENELNTKLVHNRTSDCTDTTRVPFGIITWKKMAKLILEKEYGNDTNTDSEVIPFTVISDLAQNDWQIYPDISEIYPGVGSFYIAHGHPNVTSGGLLGAVTGYTSLLTASGTWGKDTGITYATEAPDCDFDDDDTEAYEKVVKTMSDLEKKVTATTPIDYTLPGFMMSRGPLYLHMTYGFENDVAYLNEKYKDQMLYLWNDSLAFLYLEDTFLLEYPMCKLTGASWYNDDVGVVADAFVEWIKDTDATKDLLNYGFRPIGVAVNESSIINKENGCNSLADSWNVKEFESVEVNTANCMQTLYQTHKKDLQLTILLDVSGNMQTSVGDGKSRWNAISDALPTIPKVLGLNDKINLTCFEDYIIEGPGGGCSTTKYPNGTLKYSRPELVNYFSNDIAPRAKQDDVAIFEALNQTFLDVAEAEASFEQNQYRYVILVITEDDNKDDANIRAQSLLDTIGLEFNPNQIHVYPILYFGTENGITANTLEEIATRTNGQFSTASDSDLADIIEEFAYYW